MSENLRSAGNVMKTWCRGCKNVIHANRDNSVKGVNSDLALGLFSPIQVSETHDTTGLSHPSHYLPYIHYIHYIRITPPTFVKNLHRPLSEETAPGFPRSVLCNHIYRLMRYAYA